MCILDVSYFNDENCDMSLCTFRFSPEVSHSVETAVLCAVDIRSDTGITVWSEDGKKITVAYSEKL